ncbi:hypothetical protein OROHE_010996 [Orobanche hederae]
MDENSASMHPEVILEEFEGDGVDYSGYFINDNIFDTDSDAIAWAKKIALQIGFELIISSYKNKGKTKLLRCNRGERYRGVLRDLDAAARKHTKTKACKCTFQIKTEQLHDLSGWIILPMAGSKDEQSEELAHASGEHLDFSSNGSEHTSSIRGINAPSHPISSIVYNDEFDISVATFNIAVIWYHLHEYARSFSYLDTLYQNIEPIGEGTALRICLLLLDGSYKLHGEENSLTRTLSEQALEDEPLQLLSSLDISGQNLQRPGIVSANDLQRIQLEGSTSTADLRLKLHLYKVRFLLLTGNLKAAKREVKMAMNLARGKDLPLALYLKSQLEYARGN